MFISGKGSLQILVIIINIVYLGAKIIPMDKANIGLAPNVRQKVIDVLGGIIADQYVLYTKTRNYHWNVTGEDFAQYHKLF